MDDGLAVPPPDGVELAGLAVTFQRLATDHLALLDYLARSLAAAMPDAVRVKRKGFFNTGEPISVEIILGERVFDLRREHGHLQPSTASHVGGVVLAHTACQIDTWITELVAALQATAAHSDQVRAALAHLASS